MNKIYTLTVEGTFPAAHRLPHYDGSCKNMHGHTWRVVACYKYEKLYEDKEHPRCGMAQDFRVLKNQLIAVITPFDHAVLNDLYELENPTAENIAKNIFKQLVMLNEHLVWVEVWESETASVKYEPYTPPKLQKGNITGDFIDFDKLESE